LSALVPMAKGIIAAFLCRPNGGEDCVAEERGSGIGVCCYTAPEMSGQQAAARSGGLCGGMNRWYEMAEDKLQRAGRRLGKVIEDAGLLVILLATVVAAVEEVAGMVTARSVHLADLLLLFIYLEVVAMVSAYWQSGQLPVRMPLYIGMVALARYLILDMKELNEWRMLAVAAAILLLGLAVLVVRYGHVRFPYDTSGRKADNP
jgi:protein PsiE